MAMSLRDRILQSPFGEIAALLAISRDMAPLQAAGAAVVLEPFQDAADRAVELLAGASAQERTDFQPIAAESRETT